MIKIKNLVFDLGGVLLNIDYNKTAEAFKNLGVKDFDNLYSQATANDLFEALETGNITEEEFYKKIKTYCQPQVTILQIEAAWNAMLLNFRIDSLNHLKNLAESYPIYLLSNTNSIHHKAFSKILFKETGEKSLDDYFVKSYYSHLINCRKPYPNTFLYVLEDANIVAAETLFIDDSVNNIEGAKSAGMQVFHLQDGKKIQDIIL